MLIGGIVSFAFPYTEPRDTFGDSRRKGNLSENKKFSSFFVKIPKFGNHVSFSDESKPSDTHRPLAGIFLHPEDISQDGTLGKYH